MKAHIRAFGCTLNQGESMELSEMLLKSGVEIVGEKEKAHILVIHTCVVVDTTVREMVREIKSGASFHDQVHVFGCLPPTLPHLVEDESRVFLWHFGQESLFLKSIGARGHPLPLPRATNSLTAPLPIASGCIGSCSYCLTRRARGRLISRTRREVVSRLEDLHARGFREFRLTAQDTGCYGCDSGDSLVLLLEEILQNPRDFMIRTGMMNPNGLAQFAHKYKSLLKDPKMYRFLHLPVQSGADTMLERMNRGYLNKDVVRLVQFIKEEHGDLTLSTDVIVGHPGESEDDVQATMNLLEKLSPGIVNVTRFSPRPGTKSAIMQDQIAGPVMKRRSREMANFSNSVTKNFLESQQGRELFAFTIRKEKDKVVGRTENYLVVHLDSDVALGKRFQVRLETLDGIAFKGVLI